MASIPSPAQSCRCASRLLAVFLTTGALFPCAGAADLTSNFDAATDGWTASAGTTAVTLQPAGGASGGFLQGVGTGGTWYFVSPPAWAGNWSAYRTLKFDLGMPSRNYADTDIAGMVVITGTNAQTMTWTGATPLWTWTHFDVSLTPESFGVSKASFDGIMSSVASVQILGEFAALANETAGLDNVVLTATPVTVHGADLVERFNLAVKNPGETSVNGWSPVDDVTLSPVIDGVPIYCLYCDDWQDGRVFRVASPQAWSGDWRAFSEIRFDAKWSSNGGNTAGTDIVTVFGANGRVLKWSTTLPEAVWTRVVVPLTPAAFGVDAATFQGVMSHVSKVELCGEYDGGNDQFYLDNIAVATGPETGRQLGSSVVSRFGAGSEGWSVFGGASLAWSANGGFSGGGVIATETAAGTVRFLSPDYWTGDWRSFATFRFLMRTLGTARAGISPTVSILGFNGAALTYSPPPPYNSWSPYSVDLTPQTFGVTQAEYDAVMQNVAHVTIVADVLSTTDVTALDDVNLTVAGPPMGAPPGLQSTFTSDNENWRKARLTGSNWLLLTVTPEHIPEGNPDGSIAVGEELGTAYWFTPESWAGDWRGQESVSFDLRILTGTSRLAAGNMLTIVSVHGFMQQAVSAAPALNVWNQYEFALTPAAFGVTQETFDTIMRDVVMMGIRSEWISTSGQREALDNVRVSRASAAYRAWLANFLTPAQLADASLAGVSADPDGDGFSNHEEYLALTSPTDALSRFLPVARPAAGGMEIEFETKTGRSYQVWRSSGLSNDWVPAGPVVTGDDTLKVYLAPMTSGRGFFTVRPHVP